MSGNGVDLGSIYGAILAVSSEMKALKATVAAMQANMATKADVAATKADIAMLREEVRSYHASVVGHGILLTEHEDRIGQLERGEPPKAA